MQLLIFFLNEKIFNDFMDSLTEFRSFDSIICSCLR